jgi:hypothetical protein
LQVYSRVQEAAVSSRKQARARDIMVVKNFFIEVNFEKGMPKDNKANEKFQSVLKKEDNFYKTVLSIWFVSQPGPALYGCIVILLFVECIKVFFKQSGKG